MNNLSAVIYMTAQGIPFLQAGEEMLRTKIDASGGFVENSYNSPDYVNSIKWDTLEDEAYQNVYNYYKGLIALPMQLMSTQTSLPWTVSTKMCLHSGSTAA